MILLSCDETVCVFQSPLAMEGLIKCLPAVVRASGNAPEVIEAAAIAAWKHAAGEQLKDHALPLGLQDRTLRIAVADVIWQKQLHAMRGQMLFRVNSLLGQPLVGAIEFIIDSEFYANNRSGHC